MEAENIRNLINVLHVPHTDNAKLQYYAKTIGIIQLCRILHLSMNFLFLIVFIR